MVARTIGMAAQGACALAGKDLTMAAPKRFQARHEERDPRAHLVVIESRPAAGLTLAVVDTLVGEASTGMRLVASDTGEQWEVRGTAFAPIHSVEQGRQGIVLAPLGHHGPLTPGTHLEQAPVAVVGATD
jgi:hypothetical protein